MRKRFSVPLFVGAALAMALSLAIPPRAAAEVYVWVAPDGSVHFSDRPKDDAWQRLKKDGEEEAPAPPSDLDHARLNRHIVKLSRQYNIDPDLIRAMIKVESNYDPLATSRAGAMGLMQLMPGTAKVLGVKDAFDPYENVDGGVRYLSYLIRRFGGHMVHALAGYNAGPLAVENYKGVPPFPETTRYVKLVVMYYRAYRSQREAAAQQKTASNAQAERGVARNRS